MRQKLGSLKLLGLFKKNKNKNTFTKEIYIIVTCYHCGLINFAINFYWILHLSLVSPNSGKQE